MPVAARNSIISGFSGRYATALFDLASEMKQIDAVASDLTRFSALIEDNDDFRRFVLSPVFTAHEQVKAMKPILAKIKLGDLATKFLLLVAKQRRLFAVRDMIRDYSALVDDAKGTTHAKVTLADKPSDAMLATIKASLKDIAGKNVVVDLKINPEIIGGIIVQIGSRMVDSSLHTKLNSIRLAMKEVG